MANTNQTNTLEHNFAGGVAKTALLTVPEVADWLRFSPRHIKKLVQRGELRPTRLGNRQRFPLSEVRRYVRERSPV